MSNRYAKKKEREQVARCREIQKGVGFAVLVIGVLLFGIFGYSCGVFGGDDDPAIADGYVCALNVTDHAQTDGVFMTVTGDACTSRDDGDTVCSRRALTFVDFEGECFRFRDAAQDGVDVEWGGKCFLPGKHSGANIDDTINAYLQSDPSVECHVADNFQIYETCSQYEPTGGESWQEVEDLRVSLLVCCADYPTRINQPPGDNACTGGDALGF